MTVIQAIETDIYTTRALTGKRDESAGYIILLPPVKGRRSRHASSPISSNTFAGDIPDGRTTFPIDN
jgi:hypothetical protein